MLLSKELNVSIDFLLSTKKNKDSQLQLPSGSKDQSLIEKHSLRSERVLKIMVFHTRICVFCRLCNRAGNRVFKWLVSHQGNPPLQCRKGIGGR